MKCTICRRQYSPDCDYKQGRCPNHVATTPTWLLLLAAPLIIGVWMVMNPQKVWAQAKKDWYASKDK